MNVPRLLLAFLVCLSACSTTKELDLGGPVCIASKEDGAHLSCGSSDPYDKWMWVLSDIDGWYCFPPEVAKELLRRAAQHQP